MERRMIPDNTAVIAIMIMVAFAMSACSTTPTVLQEATQKNVPMKINQDRSSK